MKKVRESNYELLRIIAMFFIVVWHVIIHGNLLASTTGKLNLLINALELFIIVHVSIFMLITGYFQSKSKFRFKKLLLLILEIWFYNFFINTFLLLSGLVKYTNAEYLSQIMFYNFSSYWYIQCYIIVYLLSPFLNRLINNCSRREIKILIIILLCCFSIFPSLTFNLSYNATGSTLEHYILLYFIGAYINKYHLNDTFLNKFTVRKKRIVYLFIYFLTWLFNFSLFYLSSRLSNTNSSIVQYICSFLQFTKFYYSRPLVIIQSLSIFMLFGTFHFKNKIINKISGLTLGIYIIHEAIYLKSNLYIWLGIDGNGVINQKFIIVKVFVVSLIIFTGCLLLDLIREKIFNLLLKLKMIKKLEKKLDLIYSNMIKIE